MAGLFSKNSITNYISDSIDVGFYQYGPTLTLGGILSANKHVVLIDHISVSLQPPFQSIKKEFDWFTLQPHSALENQFDIVNAPLKFILSPNNPHKYNIMFVDNDRYAEIKSVLLNVSSAWQGLQESAYSNQTIDKLSRQQQVELFNSFCKMPITRELNHLLRNLCYWEAGTYNVDICIATKGDCFVTRKKFQLNEEEIETLKNNPSAIITSVCGQPSIDCNIIKAVLSDK